jgi:tetratricopeptide (TPR) repeat protein
MIRLPLRMVYADAPLRQPAAWLIPGSEPRTWLDEMLAWEVPLRGAVLYTIPRSASDLSPQGVLVVLPRGLVPRTTHRSQSYAAVEVAGDQAAEPSSVQRFTPASPGPSGPAPARRSLLLPAPQPARVVYLPVDARIDPAVSDVELAQVAAEGGDCILHPVLGRIRLEAGDRRKVVDLLAPNIESTVRWNLAEPGQHVNTRLTAIVPAETISLQEMLDEGRDDIGSLSPTLEELPPDPNEPSPGLVGKLGRGLQRKLAQWMQKLARAGGAGDPPPAGAGRGSRAGRGGGPGMFAQMANWARQKMAQLDDSLRKSRHRELHRLMNLLQNDPDRGLRFALPCGEGKNRGIARPSGSLANRNVDFDLRRLGGGSPADPWQLPGDLFLQLRAKYMELAGREMRLGRYRRAAYIYAHLLGDFTNAASALTAGKHWREAAALYRDRLKRPAMAARCLEQGGLWAEAIEVYAQLEEYEKVGDLYAQLEQTENAAKAWRRAVEKRLADQNLVAAAGLLESKLKAPDEALEILARAWPASPQAGACLAEQFALLGRLGRHDAAERRVRELRQEPLNAPVRVAAIDVLVGNAAGYPHDSVRMAAADATRTIVARQLRHSSGYELDHLLESIRRLVPADRLLERDTARYLRNRTQPPRPVAKQAGRALIPKPQIPAELNRVESMNLPDNVEWQCAVSCGDHYFAAGYQDRGLRLALVSWSGYGEIRQSASSLRRPILLAADPQDDVVLFHPVGGSPVSAVHFLASDAVTDARCAGLPDWMPEGIVGVALLHKGRRHALTLTEDGLILNSYDADANPAGSEPITYDSLWPDEGVATPPVLPVPMCAREAGVYVGLGDRLVLFAGETTREVFGMSGIVQSVCGSTPYSVPRLLATLEQGAALFWEEEQKASFFAEGLSRPVAAFTTSGWIVLASSDELQVYKTEGRKIQMAASQRREGRPVAVLATGHPDGFAVVREDGVVEQFQMPRR